MKSRPVPARPRPNPSLLETKQASVREAIGLCAAQLFLKRGFDETTVDDIAKAAAIGRRTFFRYFESKEDVVLWKFDQFAQHAVALLEVRPAREPAFRALQAALIAASEFYNLDPPTTVALLKMTAETPSLWAQQLMQRDRWKSWFATALRQRTRAARSSIMPELMASIGLEATAIAVYRWLADPSAELSALIEDTFSACGKVLKTPRHEPE
jgi:AcrR family transcriptional regulator